MIFVCSLFPIHVEGQIMRRLLRLSAVPSLKCDMKHVFAAGKQLLNNDMFICNKAFLSNFHGNKGRSFHTTSKLLKMRKTREEKKNKNIITFRPKPKYPLVQLWPGVTLNDVAKSTNRKLSDILEAMTYVENGFYYRSPRDEIHDKLVLQDLAKKLGFRVEFRKPYVDEKPEKKVELCRRPPPRKEDLVKRPPVVTIMGHVDHGKTTLLDSLRHSAITAQEHGGITQHIGAFMVKVPNGGHITFLDTPGHAAFHSMRSRGAQATDIVVLVVAADDGIMEQTIQSIRFAKEAKVPIIVAINKTDKPEADAEKVKQQLMTIGLQVEELGGDVQAVSISALKKINLNALVDEILALAEVKEVGADVSGPVEAVVLETRVDRGKGKISSALVQRGTLKKGCILVAGTAWGKVREMIDEHGNKMTEVKPGMPVQITGWKSFPVAGEIILEAQSERLAQEVVRHRERACAEQKAQVDILDIEKRRQEHLEKYRNERNARLLIGRHRKERAYFKDKEMVFDDNPFLSVVIKGDVHGSLEAIMDVVQTYHLHEECHLHIVGSGVGLVSENDIELAESFEGLVYSFCQEVPANVKVLAEEKGITIKVFNVIYHMIEDLQKEISAKLPLQRKEDFVGEAVVLEQFLINEGKKKIPVAGCKCSKGTMKKGNCKVLRDETVIYDGTLISLKHGKSDVESIKKDTECGLKVEDTSVTYLPGDVVICYTENFVPQTTQWNPGF